MGVLQFPIPIPVTVGSLPSLKFMVTTDSLATLTTPGYLNSANMDAGSPMAPTDIVMVLYNFDPRFQTGTFNILTVAISVTGVITLSLWRNPGVILPVIPGHIAQFFNTDGTIYDGTAPAVHFGQIQAGESGIAGSYISFPSAALSGHLALAASNNLGDFTAVITNAALGQGTTFTMPDPGTSSANFALSNAPLVNNNLIKASGSNGIVIDSGISSAAVMQNNIVNTLTSSGSIVANKSTGVSSGGIVATNGMAGFIVTESLTTAGGSRYSLTWNNASISTTSVGFLTTQGGTNTNNDYTFDLVMGSGTATIFINNNSAALLNGTIVFGYVLF